MKKPQNSAKSKNQNDLLVWTCVLGAVIISSALVLWTIRSGPESHVHIPETAFEKKPRVQETASQEPSSPSPQYDRSSAQGGREDSSSPAANDVLQRAMDLVNQGHWDQAEPMLLSELAKNPRDEGVLLELAMIQILEKHEPQAAVPYLQVAIRVNPKNDAAVEELLQVYESGQNWDQAVQFFESIPADSDGRAFINYGKGTALLSAGRNGEAIDVLQRAVYEDDNKAFTARESLATAYESNGRWEEASREYEQVISGPYKPEQIRIARIGLAKAYAAQRNFSQARSILEPIIDSDPRDRYAARVLQELNNREQRQQR